MKKILALSVLSFALANALNAEDLKIAGSSTVYPFSSFVAEEYASIKNTKTPIVESLGTGGGFKVFCEGTTDISNASRPIKLSEFEACKKNGVTDIVGIMIGLTIAKKYLMRDDFNTLVKVELREDPYIKVDIETFSLIVKNLIDNALKYSSNGTCELYCDKKYFKITNPGEALTHPIEYYFGAFTRERQQQVKGMGLGLYIVSEVCKLHNFKLVYAYEDNKHCFKVFFKEQ